MPPTHDQTFALILPQERIRFVKTQTKQNATVFDQLVSHVTITDPTHALFGRTLPVIRTPAPAHWKRFVLVELPTGEPRRVPCSATDLAQSTSSQSALEACSLPISARTLVPLAHAVRRLLGATEESPDENRPELTIEEPRNPTGPEQSRAAQPLAGAGGSSPTATGAVSGHPAVAHTLCNTHRHRGE